MKAFAGRLQSRQDQESSDARASVFAEECRRQARAVAAADSADPTLAALMDATLADVNEAAHTLER